MTLSSSFLRFRAYYQRHGIGATVDRARQGAIRAFFFNGLVLFEFELANDIPGPKALPSSINIERKTAETEISPSDLKDFLGFWNPELAHAEMRGRFLAGASLWLLKYSGGLAAYGWTLGGSTMEQHPLQFGPEDVHLFDYYVAPSHRGRGLNPLLVNYILGKLAAEGWKRAFIEAAEWNRAQLSSLKKTPFRRVGCAKKPWWRPRGN